MKKIIRKKNISGFTLIEMLVVILIIVILIAIAVPAVAGYRRDAQETTDKAAVRTLYTALEAASVNVSPTELAGTVNNYISGQVDIDNPPDDDYSKAVVELLGENFTGSFRFGFYRNNGSIRWVSWWDEDTSDEGIMLYDIENGNLGYLSDLKDEYADTIHYRPTGIIM